jgi:hypothetical protein
MAVASGDESRHAIVVRDPVADCSSALLQFQSRSGDYLGRRDSSAPNCSRLVVPVFVIAR